MAYRAGVPGLDKAVTEEDLEKSRNIYNQLPNDSQQPEIRESLIHDLAKLFVRNHADTVFGIHLAHGHFPVPNNTVLLGVNQERPRCRLANATAFQEIDLDKVHGHIFILTDNGFHPYEYQTGPVPDLTQVDDHFLTELAGFLKEYDLTTLVGLQIIDPYPGHMFELILPKGTIMLDASSVDGCVPTRQTGWKFVDVNGEPRVCKGEVHAQHSKGHDTFIIEGAPHPKVETFEDIKHALKEQGILRSM